MAIEIERKFLIRHSDFLAGRQGTLYRQGYLASGVATVRVRIAGEKAFLTIKGQTRGISRTEFEYPVAVDEAAVMLNTLCSGPLIEKTRYRVDHAGKCWEVDVFHGDNQGLIVAEVELASADEAITLPDWIDREVSDDPRYFNSQLALHPFCDWPASDNHDTDHR